MVRFYRPKDVHVCQYTRIRFNRLEVVRHHWRSHPRQYYLPF